MLNESEMWQEMWFLLSLVPRLSTCDIKFLNILKKGRSLRVKNVRQVSTLIVTHTEHAQAIKGAGSCGSEPTFCGKFKYYTQGQTHVAIAELATCTVGDTVSRLLLTMTVVVRQHFFHHRTLCCSYKSSSLNF